jgi:DNA (cytosine-5)-methyltransferase 1
MEFDSKDFDRVKRELLEGYTKKEKIYQQAGNSIVVNILESIFRNIYENEMGR